jgi:hypothetical protein
VRNYSLGTKQYEQSSHLGNVHVVVSDKKLALDSNNDGIIDGYISNLVAANDYFAFGSLRTGRNFNSSSFNFGFQGQQKVDEISGEGNHYTAQYWEMDPRLGRRWNRDPKPNPSISEYACFANSPIMYSDHEGDTIRLAGSKPQKYLTLWFLQKLTNDDIVLKNNDVVIKSLGTENKTKNLHFGTKLIRRLIGEDNVITIKIGTPGDGNSARPDSRKSNGDTDWTKSQNGTGDNVTVTFDPTANPDIKTVEPSTGNVSDAKRPDEIGLGHELIHSDHMSRGDVRLNSETHTYQTSGGKVTQKENSEELRTVGLKGAKKGQVTENQLRKEQGLNKRGAY